MVALPTNYNNYSRALMYLSASALWAAADCRAAEQIYARAPLIAFASQMRDSLTGGGRYEKPVWNLHDALNLPDWLEFSVEHRSRYETMDGNFRARSTGGDQQIALQTGVWAEAHLGRFRAGGEFLDARALAIDAGSNVNNTQTDEADFLQGYVAWAVQNLNYSGIGAEAVLGRQTINLGSRRLAARNYFRNTINSFTGLKIRLTDYGKWQFTGFITVPVIRYPTGSEQILADVRQWDKEDTHTWFSGGFLEASDLVLGINGELYLYRLDEADSPRNPTRNRRYFTPGFRLFIKPKAGEFDFQTETIGQFGTARASARANDGVNLDHAAWYQHVDIGYTFDAPGQPRMAAEYDYASGDKNPNDSHDQRFDTLYGARRFDYGPTGIYGPFARSNISTPGLRMSASPRYDIQLNAGYRAFWLASDTDAWTTTGGANFLQDRTGNTDSFVGQQVEVMARYDFNSSLNFETGWAHLFKGPFAKHAPNAPAGQDINYFYVQSLLRF